MNSKTVIFSIPAIAVVIVLFGSGPLVANQQVQALGGFGGGHAHWHDLWL